MRSVLLALAAAASIAVASALQHHAATDDGVSARPRRGLMLSLVRKPRWMVGFGFSAASLVLHGAALHGGRLGVVQPLLVTSLIFALALRAALDRRRLSGREVVAAAVLAAALTGFLLAAHPMAGTDVPDGSDAGVLIGAGVGAVLLAVVVSRRTRSPTVAGLCLGSATGILYGMVGGTLKATVHQISVAPSALVTTWPLWSLLAIGAWALVTNQQAYSRAPLSTSLPALMVLNPVVGVAFGAYVFAEKPADNVGAVIAQLVCLSVVAAAIAALARLAVLD